MPQLIFTTVQAADVHPSTAWRRVVESLEKCPKTLYDTPPALSEANASAG